MGVYFVDTGGTSTVPPDLQGTVPTQPKGLPHNGRAVSGAPEALESHLQEARQRQHRGTTEAQQGHYRGTTGSHYRDTAGTLQRHYGGHYRGITGALHGALQGHCRGITCHYRGMTGVL